MNCQAKCFGNMNIYLAGNRSKKTTNRLEGWREVILSLNSILLWEKNSYLGCIVGLTTLMLLPGIQHHGYIDKYTSSIQGTLFSFLRSSVNLKQD